MGKILPVARLGNDLSAGGIHLPAGDPSPGGVDPRPLGGQHNGVYLLHLLSGLSHGHSAGHIRAVALHPASKVHGDEHPIFHRSIPGHGVRPGTVWPGSHDRGKGQLLPAPAHHLIYQAGGDLPLRHAGTDEVQHRLKRPVGDLLGMAHHRQLLLVLAGTQVVQQLLGWGEDAGQLLAVAPVGIHRHVAAFKAHVVQSALLQKGPGLGQVAAVWGDKLHIRPLDLLLSGLDIPSVGGVVGLFPGDEQQPLPVKADGIALPGLAGDEHGIQSILRQLLCDLF